ncbi:MAG: amino acid ABC transporter permease [Oscillospiraceae bacterium]
MQEWFAKIQEWFATIGEKFYDNFILDDKWQYLTKGLAVTLKITFFAVIMGIAIGFLVAIVRASYDKTKSSRDAKSKASFGNIIFNIVNGICKLYLTVIRGTPVVVQLMIIYFVIFASVDVNKTVVACIAFGINSGAYVAEIVRSGIMSIDNGQFEAGRSLGFNYPQTMVHIIMPQAFKNILPALGNEFIVLLKETSVSGFIGLQDLTRGGDIIKSITYEPIMPLLAVALIYLVFVVIFQALVNRLERRLRNRDH